MSSIKKKFVSGVVWESFGHFSALGIQFFVTILIARILLPSEFGVIGLLTVFIALGQILLDSGFSQALIQKKDATQVDLSSVYFLNMVVGLLIYLILFIASPFIASFYDLPELTAYARVIFLIIPINSFGLIQNVIIQKELDFKKTATASVVSAIFSGIVGVGLAYSGFGIWALVWQQVSLNASRTLLFVIQRRWMPKFVLSIISVKEMFTFSMNLMFHSIVNVTMKNIYALVIGKFYPVEQVGYYTQADKFQEISASTLSNIVIKVSFPALVHKKDEPEYLRLAYSKIFSTTVFIIAPLMIFLMLIGDPLFRVLLTDKWLPAVPYFKILCIYGMLLPILQISYNLYKLYKKGKMLLIIDSLRHLLVIVSIFFTIAYSILDMLIGLVLCTIIMTLANLYKSGQLINLSLFSQLKSLLPYYIIGGAIGFVLSFLPLLSSDLLSICLSAVLFWPIYIIITAILKLEGYIELKNIMRSLFKKFI